MNGAELIAEERKRQVEQEGWTSEHDDEHVNGELAIAACWYAKCGAVTHPFLLDDWPFEKEWYKPDDPIRNLVKAGALIAAEIDRLQRKREREG